MTEIAEPKPCPFCGSENMRPSNLGEDFFVNYDGDQDYWILCEDCGACGPFKGTLVEAIDAWNAAPRRTNKDGK